MSRNQSSALAAKVIGPVAGMAAGLLAVTAIAYLHYRSGLAYEFHIFFLLPAALAAWFLGLRAGAVMAVAAIGAWAVTDWLLGGATARAAPLIFNGVMRLGAFFLVVWLLVRLKAAFARETELAHHDALTGLGNRRRFETEGTLALAQVRRQHEPCTALVMDIDRFKQVNDTRGHAAGDALLRAVAEVLRQHVRTSDIVARLGGDEFALLLPGMGEAAASAYAQALQERLREHMRARDWPVGFSIGLVCFQQPPADIGTVVARADALMYRAKHAGGDRIVQETVERAPPAARAVAGG